MGSRILYGIFTWGFWSERRGCKIALGNRESCAHVLCFGFQLGAYAVFRAGWEKTGGGDVMSVCIV